MDIGKETAKVTGREADDAEEVGLVHEFDFSYTDARGKVWTGKFRNHILNYNAQAEQAVLAAKLRGGLPASAFSAEHNFWIRCLSHVSVSLDLEIRPDWARDLGQLHDVGICVALWKEVNAHEDRFWGRGKDQVQGAGDGGGAQVQGRAPSVGAPERQAGAPDVG